MTENIKINWYRCKVDKAVMSELMRKSDAKAFAQVIPQLLLYVATGTLAYLAFTNVHVYNWHWSLPVLLLAVFVHGSFTHFFGGVAGHELSHKTPFATQALNTFFLRVFSFLGVFDFYGYRASHIRHHQATTHADHDGEVVLPQGGDWEGFKFFLKIFTIDPPYLLRTIRFWIAAARGNVRDGFFKAPWLERVLPESSVEQRREFRNWARVVVFGHLALAILFVATGHWFLIVLVTFGAHMCPWMGFLVAGPQHAGLTPNASDFRLCVRTYTCGWLPAFLYWNMQYHLEHHMFPAVPFYNLPKLRKAIEHDLPPAPHGLRATWKELRTILRRQKADPTYVFVPKLSRDEGACVSDTVLQAEASQDA